MAYGEGRTREGDADLIVCCFIAFILIFIRNAVNWRRMRLK
jgi:hypothetical protein